MWQPSATINTLKRRAKILKNIRDFFWSRGVLEVETPILSHFTITDPYVIGIPAVFKNLGAHEEKQMFLQTSPEYAMKRLLAANSGSIFQITKSFRQGEIGSNHNPEFTMLEWYRINYDHHALMDEMAELLQIILGTQPPERMSYAQAFESFVNIDPHTASIGELEDKASHLGINFQSHLETDKNLWLDLLFTHCIEPNLGKHTPVFIYDFPSSQAALAKIREENPAVASRFEVYFKGVELANGFHELQDAKEQSTRFENELKLKEKLGVTLSEQDKNFLAALQHGLPDCSGVALGVDRLVMLAENLTSIEEVISFAFANA